MKTKLFRIEFFNNMSLAIRNANKQTSITKVMNKRPFVST